MIIMWLAILFGSSLILSFLGMICCLTPILYFFLWKVLRAKWRWACAEYFRFWD